MNKRRYWLPDGGTTMDANQYCEAWTEPGRLVADALGMTLHGYDPRFSFLSTGDSAVIPAKAVLKLAKLLKELHYGEAR
jgi:hypothetical protein